MARGEPTNPVTTTVFWDMSPFSLVGVYGWFEEHVAPIFSTHLPHWYHIPAIAMIPSQAYKKQHYVPAKHIEESITITIIIWDGQGKQHAWTRVIRIVFWWESQKERDR
jgi:hypothetical protein